MGPWSFLEVSLDAMSVPFIWGVLISADIRVAAFNVTLLLGLTWQGKARNEQQHLLEVSWSLFNGVLTGDVPGRAGSCRKDHFGALGQTGAEGDVPTCKAAGRWFPWGTALFWGHIQSAAAWSLGWTVAGGLPGRAPAVGKRLTSGLRAASLVQITTS